MYQFTRVRFSSPSTCLCGVPAASEYKELSNTALSSEVMLHSVLLSSTTSLSATCLWHGGSSFLPLLVQLQRPLLLQRSWILSPFRPSLAIWVCNSLFAWMVDCVLPLRLMILTSSFPPRGLFSPNNSSKSQACSSCLIANDCMEAFANWCCVAGSYVWLDLSACACYLCVAMFELAMVVKYIQKVCIVQMNAA